MAYSLISVADLTELKSRRGNSTNTTMATIMGLTYPLIEAWSVYAWDNTSTAIPDDDEIVQPTIGGITTGRWFKVDLDTIPQANSDWNASSGVTEILNKPILFSGAYADLTGKPTLFSGAYNDLTGKPVLFDGDYNSLINKPTIPTNTNQLTNGAGFISVETDPIWTAASVNYRTKAQNDLLYKDINYVPTWVSITGKPTFATVATTGSYTDLINKPKLPTTYSGTTNASGNYTVTFPVAYSVAPNIQVCLINANVRDTPIVTVSTTGFTVNIQRRTDVLGLLPTYANVTGGLVDVLITEK